MESKKQLHKNLFLGLILVFGAISIYAIKASETPRFVLFLGRFHPLLLHMPIGALVVTFFIDVLGRFQKNYAVNTVKNLLGFTAFFAITTCFLGYFLSLEGGYEEQTLDLHFYTGIGTAVLATVLFYLSLKSDFESKKVFLPLFVVTLVCVSIAGHFGSVLTHGDSFLTEYAVAEEKERTIEVVDSLKLYNDVVAKIFDNKCVQCHNATKRKGNLSLITKGHILEGGENGASLISGNAKGSLLYKQLVLPISDEDHMPPEGKEQLTKDEIWLIEHWINGGLDFENYVAHIEENATLRKNLQKYLVFNKIEIPKATKSDIVEVREQGFRVSAIVPGGSELSIKYLSKAPDAAAIDKLSQIEEQIVELDFNAVELTDAMTSVLKGMDNLRSLRINSTKLTDAALKNLRKLEHLEVLNLYNTKVTNVGLSELLKTVKPKQIYAWKTEVDKETAMKLATQYDVNIHHSISEGFVEESQLETPIISPAKTLFMDTIHVAIRSDLKNVELRYTVDNTVPDSTSQIISNPLVLDKSATLRVAAFKKGWLSSETVFKEYVKVQHRVSDFTMKIMPDERYPGEEKLFDLAEGSTQFSDGNWVGHYGTDLDVNMDLGAVKSVDRISFSCLEDVGSWIMFPKKATLYASGTKNGTYKEVGSVDIPRKGQGGVVEIKKVTFQIPETEARYFRLAINNFKTLPDWHPGKGNPSWLFVDEIFIW